MSRKKIRKSTRKLREQEQTGDAQGAVGQPAAAGAPLVRHFPPDMSGLSPDESTVLKETGWTPQLRAAVLEARLARHMAAGVAPAQAREAAEAHMTEAIQRGLQPPALVIHSHIHGHALGHESHGIIHKHAHAHVKGALHPHPSQHYHTHAAVGGQEKLHESFSWTMPFKSKLQAGKRLIQGAAITVGKTLNKIPYTKDELLRSARTLAKKPIFINHLETVQEAKQYLTDKGDQLSALVRKAIQGIISRNDPRVGFVRDSEFADDDQAVEYVGEVTDPATQDLVKAGEALGVSIGAVPRDMVDDKPVGIMFEDLSIITKPETPGDPDATIKMMEKLMEMMREQSPPPGDDDSEEFDMLSGDELDELEALSDEEFEQQLIETGWTPAARAAAAAARRARTTAKKAAGQPPAPKVPKAKAPKVRKPRVSKPRTKKTKAAAAELDAHLDAGKPSLIDVLLEQRRVVIEQERRVIQEKERRVIQEQIDRATAALRSFTVTR